MYVSKGWNELEEDVFDSSLLAANRKAMLDDNARINTLLADLPQSVQFECPVERAGVVTIRFKPLTSASSLNLEKRILSGMGGKLQLDLNDMRLVSASGSEEEGASHSLALRA